MSAGTFSPVGPPAVKTSCFAEESIISDLEDVSENGSGGRVRFGNPEEGDVICTGPEADGDDFYRLQTIGPVSGTTVVTVEYHPIKKGLVTRGSGRAGPGCGPVIFLRNGSLICCINSKGGPGPIWTTSCGGEDAGEVWEVTEK